MRRGLAVALLVGLFASLAGAVAPQAALGFDRFGEMEADATFGEEVRFSVELVGEAPEQLDLLLEFGEGDVVFVQPVEPDGRTAEFVLDAEEEYIAPNTPIAYSWRATEGTDDPIVSREETILYDDDRPSLDWEVLDVGQARVHWYGDEDEIAERLGQRTSDAVARSEQLFGAELGEPVDIFLYRSREDFFGAIEPRAREWVGGEARSEIRTIYAWLEAGSESFLELLLFHEVAHMVFADSIENPYHQPPRWMDEGLATWIETQGADRERAIVEDAAVGGRLVAFDAIAEQFPAGSAEAEVAYAQSATLMDDIIQTYGEDAIAQMNAAYRDGATDAEAIEAGTGESLERIFQDWFAKYGEEVPEPVPAEPLLPAEGGLPEGVTESPGPRESADGEGGGAPGDDRGPSSSRDDDGAGWLFPVTGVAVVTVLVLAGVALKVATSRPVRDGDG